MKSLDEFAEYLAQTVTSPTERDVRAAIILARELAKGAGLSSSRFIEICLAQSIGLGPSIDESTDLDTDVRHED